MSDSPEPEPRPSEEGAPLGARLGRLILGAPRQLSDRGLFHRLALVPVLAWIGLGADGLSSSSYGPDEAFRALGEHSYLAVALAAAMAFTIALISAAYSRIIEEFPHGGGGYLVATRLLGPRAGVVSGSALLVDYVLTITVSIAASGDAIFSFLPLGWHVWKEPYEILLIIGLTLLNLRGVRESILALAPIFVLFVVTHVVLIAAAIGEHAAVLPQTVSHVGEGFRQGSATLGIAGMLMLLLHAFSMGGGTYTGLEAVSNGLPLMREPRAKTARRTMRYMAVSLAFTASGLMLGYLLWNVGHVPGKTMNAVLVEAVAGGWPLGLGFVLLTLVSEGALLVVGAQAGFLDGPRVLANMAVDSWVPRRFATLSDRLTTHNGIVLMGAASLAALLYTGGSVSALVVMYSINVFLTFSLSMLGMLRLWLGKRRGQPFWKRRSLLFGTGFLLCSLILVVTVREKFAVGGWLTLALTGGVVVLCGWIRRHYRKVGQALQRLYAMLEDMPAPAADAVPPGDPDPRQPAAVVLVGSYGSLGVHTVLNIFRSFPGYYHTLIFIMVGQVDSEAAKGEDPVGELRQSTEREAARYVELARGLGLPALARTAVGTDVVAEADELCRQIRRDFPRCTYFAGKVIFEREHWYQRLFHNETAMSLQKRLQWAGQTMVILPARVKVN